MQNKFASKSCQQLWLARVADTTLSIEESTKSLLSESERQRFNTIKSPKRRREFLLSRALMRHALSQMFNRPVSDWQFIHIPHSAPLIQNLPPNIYVSLSHSNGFICFITSQAPVGIDIEDISKKRNYFEAAQLFMNNNEIKQLKREDKLNVPNKFYRVWCAKEAYFKATQTNFLGDVNEVTILDFLKNSTKWHLTEKYLDNYLITIVTQNKALPLSKQWL